MALLVYISSWRWLMCFDDWMISINPVFHLFWKALVVASVMSLRRSIFISTTSGQKPLVWACQNKSLTCNDRVVHLLRSKGLGLSAQLRILAKFPSGTWRLVRQTKIWPRRGVLRPISGSLRKRFWDYLVPPLRFRTGQVGSRCFRKIRVYSYTPSLTKHKKLEHTLDIDGKQFVWFVDICEEHKGRDTCSIE